jgi:Tfp pilus assembly protein PilW
MSARRQRGSALVDTLVGTLMSLLVLAAILGLFEAQEQAQGVQDVYGASQTVTRTVIDLMSRELRMASYDPTGTALATSPGPSCPGVTQGIVSATSTSVRFQQDLDGDGRLLSPGEDVTYDVLGTQVRRTDAATGVPVVLVDAAVQNPLTFLYFDGSNPPIQLVPGGTPPQLTTAQRNCVAKIQVVIQASLPSPSPSAPQRLNSTAETMVAIRNRSLANF